MNTINRKHKKNPGRTIAMITIICLSVLALFPAGLLFAAESDDLKAGETLFTKHCASCHPNGGNILNPNKSLSQKDREANKILTAQDIVNKMRSSGPAPTHPQQWSGMKMFDEKTISNDDALKIAYYIMQTFR
jgi:cytochrome c6